MPIFERAVALDGAVGHVNNYLGFRMAFGQMTGGLERLCLFLMHTARAFGPVDFDGPTIIFWKNVIGCTHGFPFSFWISHKGGEAEQEERRQCRFFLHSRFEDGKARPMPTPGFGPAKLFPFSIFPAMADAKPLTRPAKFA